VQISHNMDVTRGLHGYEVKLRRKVKVTYIEDGEASASFPSFPEPKDRRLGANPNLKAPASGMGEACAVTELPATLSFLITGFEVGVAVSATAGCPSVLSSFSLTCVEILEQSLCLRAPRNLSTVGSTTGLKNESDCKNESEIEIDREGGYTK
jgi:hypothetical protein